MGHQEELFDAAIEYLGIDLGNEAFSGMRVKLEGLTPMERFLSGREDRLWSIGFIGTGKDGSLTPQFPLLLEGDTAPAQLCSGRVTPG